MLPARFLLFSLTTHSCFGRNVGSQGPVLISALNRKETRCPPVPRHLLVLSSCAGPCRIAASKGNLFSWGFLLRRVSSHGLSTPKHLGLRYSKYVFPVFSLLSKPLSDAEFLLVINIQGPSFPQKVAESCPAEFSKVRVAAFLSPELWANALMLGLAVRNVGPDGSTHF